MIFKRNTNENKKKSKNTKKPKPEISMMENKNLTQALSNASAFAKMFVMHELHRYYCGMEKKIGGNLCFFFAVVWVLSL